MRWDLGDSNFQKLWSRFNDAVDGYLRMEDKLATKYVQWFALSLQPIDSTDDQINAFGDLVTFVGKNVAELALDSDIENPLTTVKAYLEGVKALVYGAWGRDDRNEIFEDFYKKFYELSKLSEADAEQYACLIEHKII
ncbi:MAG: hypothetical protein GOV00_02865 [Candidatus Altiarchaeota archaeon]|nr:hypothetical protein [Candidatus Altiarchaeota archaeon]